jgi:hypothetical protein
MKMEPPVQRLLKWRTALAEAEAPPAPRAARLLERARPWWQRQPERFAALAAALNGMHAHFGHAMDPGAGQGSGIPVAAVLLWTNLETNSLAHILYFHVRARTLRLRFQLQNTPEAPERDLDVTFVAAESHQPLFSAFATFAPGGEYRIELDLPAALAEAWAPLRVTDRMPFRFILRPQEEV